MSMKYLFVLAFCFMSCLRVMPQAKFVESWIYSDVSLSRGAQTRSVRSMVDTGCSFCVIDSAYATDVFKIRDNDYIIKGYRKKTNFIVLDSLSFCGTSYRKVYCMVMDLSGKLIDYAPRFIIGGNILIKGVWKFDLKNNSVEPSDIKRKPTGTVIHWNYYPKKKHVNAIRLKGIIGKDKVGFLFDTGSRHCKLPKGFDAGPTETVRKESANEMHSLQMVEAELTRNVHFKIGKYEFTHDFFDGQHDDGVLNAYSFGGNVVILNYKRQTLEVVLDK
ncbi:MAG: hypothetical protein IJ163_01175 [Bacteroidaceae bacterium]|nr:hypothetical protein [Bacteroidaceae bacterium]